MEELEIILRKIYSRELHPIQAKQQVLDLFGKISKEQIYKAIDFGTELGQTTGYHEGADSWIDDMIDKFMETLNKEPNQ